MSIIPPDRAQRPSYNPIAQTELLLDQYETTFFSPNTTLENIELFLIAENSNHSRSIRMNGNLISNIGRSQPVRLFVGGIPSWRLSELRFEIFSKKEINPSSCDAVFGWDLDYPTLEAIGHTEATREGLSQKLLLTKERIAKLEKMDQKYESDLKKTQEKARESLEKGQVKTYQTYTSLITTLQKQIHNNQNEISFSMELKAKLERELAKPVATDESIKEGFFKQTLAIVETLKKLRSHGSSQKTVLIADILHFYNLSEFKELDLTLLYEELNHHKAAILVPKILLPDSSYFTVAS